MRSLPISLFLLVLATLMSYAYSLRHIRREPGMNFDAKPPPTCEAGDMGEVETRINAYENLSSQGDTFLGCCSKHLQCYCICENNLSKQLCDEGFRRCLQSACVDKLPTKGNFEKRRCSSGWSWNGPGMVNAQVANSPEFSCERYQDIQASCCSE
ncbi:hypothetical protein K7432_004085 [Basidiobolus ranarum]|uniref:Uncharacterized protein n=1 Tax=Basidiobolus ranarum TaxID=34480 RepID=A0ABR2W564_9FUNG